jgi:hypothetical protein
VCVWENQFAEFDCASSENYYEESNRAFFGNSTAEANMNENIKNSQEIKNIEILTMSPIKLYEIIPMEELSMTNSESELIEKNSIEEPNSSTNEMESVSEEIDESNDYQAELIPSSTNHFDASIATSSESDISASHRPQKIISLSVIDPIVELPDSTTLPSVSEVSTTDENSEAKAIRKRSGNYRNRFLFKADAH